MKGISSLLFLLLSFSAIAQVNIKTYRPSIRTFDGKTHEGDVLIFHRLNGDNAMFALDGTAYLSKDVEFLENIHGAFANCGAWCGFDEPHFALRTFKGRMNTYESIDMEAYGQAELQTNPDEFDLATGADFDYYNIGFEPLREVTYKNLQGDVSNYPPSLRYLRDYNKFRFVQAGLIGLGTGIIATNLIMQAGGKITFNPILLLGVVVSGSSYFLEQAKSDALWLSVDEYNAMPADFQLKSNK
ncbi:MAG: hypothetical protein ACKO66_07230 [Flavobacteriales bacterium]